MFLPVIASLALLCLLTTSVTANPAVVQVRDSPFTLPFARRLNVTGTLDLVLRDQVRARYFAKQGGIPASEATSDVGLTNAGVDYVARVGVGSPPTYYNLIVDTGSSNTWVGAEKPYVRTKISVDTYNAVTQSYGSGWFFGIEYTDTVTIASGLVISGQSMGVAEASKGFDGVDGILGIGPVNLTLGSLFPSIHSSIPTVTHNLFKHGAIATELVSVSFEPTTVSSIKNGELTFGRTDSTKFTGPLTYIPITGKDPAKRYWGIDQSIRYGTSPEPILDAGSGIVDTGTTLILLATNAFDRYRRAIGAVLDPNTKLLSITPAQYANLKSLFFTIGDRTFELTANAQIWPRALNELIGGERGCIYLVVNDIGSIAGAGLDFINGYTFLERFYSVFDTGGRRVGLATTQFTTAKNN